jgi:hypothetical protein
MHLYDALISISVPHDKAVAVANSLRADMNEHFVSKIEMQTEMQKITAMFEKIDAKFDLVEARIMNKVYVAIGASTIASITIISVVMKFLIK